MDTVNTALEAIASHTRNMEVLAEKLLGKAALAHGRAITDHWFRAQWYMHRIFDLGCWAGANRQRMRRCRNTDREPWARYELAEQECLQVAEHLMLEFLTLPGCADTQDIQGGGRPT